MLSMEPFYPADFERNVTDIKAILNIFFTTLHFSDRLIESESNISKIGSL